MKESVEFEPFPRSALALFLFGILLAAAAAQNAAAGFEPIASALQNGEFQKALELLRPALQASPRNAQLWAMQGAAYAGEGHPKEALGSFRARSKFLRTISRRCKGRSKSSTRQGTRLRFHSCSVC